MTIAASPVNVQSENVIRTETTLESKYTYETSHVTVNNGIVNAVPVKKDYVFKLDLEVPKVGLLLVGLGGNNGSTAVAAVLANKYGVLFETKDGVIEPNYYGSMTQSLTIKIGVDESGNDAYVPFNLLVPMVNPNDLVIGGWDISSANLKEAAKRSKVLDVDLQKKLADRLEQYKPMPLVYYPDFIAANQEERADNVLKNENKWDDVEQIRKDIRDFKAKHSLDKIIVLWTANTERYCDVTPGVHDTSANFLKAIKENHSEIPPSAIFATACILEDVPYINGSPQNTFVPGLVQFAEENDAFIAGDDFKTGQTKIKSVLAQYLVDAGIKPVSIASYNHLGNNDGYNLSSYKQFRSKEILKQLVVDDMIQSNRILYNKKSGDKVDHCVVIKYVPAVGDSKVAMDEYYSELMLGGHNRIAIHNTCEDSLLAVPLMLDLVIMTELLSRILYKEAGKSYERMYSVLGFLSYWLKAPLTKEGFDPINGLNRQRFALENLLKLLVGLPVNNELRFEERLK